MRQKKRVVSIFGFVICVQTYSAVMPLCMPDAVSVMSFVISIGFRWFCHVDDDNYVNVPALDELLKMYNPIGDWYLGRTSTPKPLQIRTKPQVS